MNFRRYFAIITASLAIASPAAAGDLRQGAKAVIELFTSQGCSSCPKADAMFDALAKRQDVVALAYHVDYWDYIGWADTFGAKANSDLQRDYADSWGSSRIFTPQLVVNGAGSVVGSREDEVKAALAKATLPLEVNLGASKDMLEVSVAARSGLNDAVVWLITFIDRADVAIERGENEGKEVTYSQIVTGRQVVGMWEPGSGAHLKLPLAEVLTGKSNGAVILVQEERNGLPGPILGASSFSR
jgi:hypothetical protein